MCVRVAGQMRFTCVMAIPLIVWSRCCLSCQLRCPLVFFLLLLLRCPLGFIFTNNNSTCPPDTPNFVLHHKNKSVNIYFNHK